MFAFSFTWLNSTRGVHEVHAFLAPAVQVVELTL